VRPKGRRGFKTELIMELAEPTEIGGSERPTTMTKQRAIVITLLREAIGGDLRAIDIVIRACAPTSLRRGSRCRSAGGSGHHRRADGAVSQAGRQMSAAADHLIQNSQLAFAMKAFAKRPGQQLAPLPYVKFVVAHLDKVASGRVNRLIVACHRAI
jgi:hypothetical protein